MTIGLPPAPVPTAPQLPTGNKKAPQARGLRGFQGSVLDDIKHITGGNGVRRCRVSGRVI